MRRIIYLSHPSPEMTLEKAEAIVEKSRRKNSACGLTGALVLENGTFLQILEGPELALEERWSAIQRDRRHHGLMMIYDGSVNTRSYPDQPMALLHLSSLPQDARVALEEMFALEPKPLPRRLRDILPRFTGSMAA